MLVLVYPRAQVPLTATNTILAYVFGKRTDDVFKQLKALLAPLGISHYYLCPLGT